MNKIVLFYLYAACASSLLVDKVWGEPGDSGRAVLTPSSFHAFKVSRSPFLLIVIKPNCAECGSIKAVSAALARQSDIGGMQVPIAQIDAGEYEDFVKDQGLFQLGELFLVGKDTIHKYEGEKEAKEIERWVVKKIGKAAKHLLTLQDVDNLKEELNSLVYYVPQNADDAISEFNEAARRMTSECGYVEGDKLRKTESLKEPFALVFTSKTLDRKVLERASMFSRDEIIKFESDCLYERVPEFDQNGAEMIFNAQKIGVVLFGPEDMEWFDKAARDYKKQFAFYRCKPGHEFSKRLMEYVGVGEEEPAIRILKSDKTRGGIFKYKCDVSSDGLKQCIDAFESGKLEPVLKSQPVPASNDKPVRVVVGESFQEEVIDSDKHVFLKIYAPWCGHCQHLAPVWEKLAEKLKRNSELVIAEFDGTANEVASLHIASFPTLKLFKRGHKSEPIDYTGQRDEESFLKFLEQQLEIIPKEDKGR